MDNSSANSVRSVSRALDILLAFREGDGELSATDLLARLGLSRATLYRLLHTLEQAGFVHAAGEPRRFRLGASVAQLARVWAAAKDQTPDIATVARPMMRRLWQQTGETVALFTPDGTDRVCMAELASAQALSFRRGVGHRERLMLGASGRTILAHLPHAPVALKTYAKDLPPGIKIDLKSYAAELEQTRKRGYAVSRSELIQGALAMAAPFFNNTGKVAGSLAVYGPSVRLDNTRVKSICAVLVAQAARLSNALGYRSVQRRADTTIPDTIRANASAW